MWPFFACFCWSAACYVSTGHLHMVWFFERQTDLLVCEIRHDVEHAAYEFEVASPGAPPTTQSFSSPTELIDSYLRMQSQLRAQGWRPRASDIAVLE